MKLSMEREKPGRKNRDRLTDGMRDASDSYHVKEPCDGGGGEGG